MTTELTEEKSEDPEGQKRLSLSALRRLLALVRPYRALLIVAGTFLLISTSISLSIPLVARSALDNVLKTQQIGAMDRLALLMLALILIASLLGFAEHLLIATMGNRIVMDMRGRLFAHLQRLPVAFFDKARSGNLTSHLSNDVTLLQETLTGDLVRLAGNVVTLVGGIAMALFIDWRLTAIVVGLLASVFSLFVVFGARLRRLTRLSLDALSDTMGAMTEALANIRLVKAFAREDHETARARTKLENVYRLAIRSSAFEGTLGFFGGVGFTAILIAVIWYGGRSVLSGQMTTGTLVAFFLTVMIISGPMGSLASLYARLQRATGAADRLFALLDTPPEPPDAPDAVAFPDGPGAITFESVDFAYAPDLPVLSKLSLDVPAGKVTALVGASGAGKTTLALLLYRFYDPQQGCIRIDGAPIEKIRRQELRENIGLVPQEPVLFNGTIRENIRYGRLEATDAEIEAAAKAAHVAEFVENLPEKYDTPLGERGVTLSGGQRQRVAIARALLKNPRILVLDEATSALDTRSEALVRDALDRLMQGRTTLVIAHRLTTIQNADQIAVLHEGQVVERGCHTLLLQQNGRYAALQNGNGDFGMFAVVEEVAREEFTREESAA